MSGCEHSASPAMTSAAQKADAFIVKLAGSLAASQPPASAAHLSDSFQQAISSLPSSRLRTHLLAHAADYATRLVELYTSQLPPSPPPVAPLLWPAAFPAEPAVPVFSSSSAPALPPFLLPSITPLATLRRFFLTSLREHAKGEQPLLPLLHLALCRHRERAGALLTCMDAAVAWVREELSTTPSPSEVLRSLLASLLSLFQSHHHQLLTAASSSSSFAAQYQRRLCWLLLYELVWTAADIDVRLLCARVRGCLSSLLPPPSALHPDAELLLLCSYAALLAEKKKLTAVASSHWLSREQLASFLGASLPALTRCLLSSEDVVRAVALLRLPILHSALPAALRSVLLFKLSPFLASPPPSSLVSFLQHQGFSSLQHWVKQGEQRAGREAITLQLRKRGAAVDERQPERGRQEEETQQEEENEEEEEDAAAGGWYDDRTGERDAISSELRGLMAELRADRARTGEEQKDEQKVEQEVGQLIASSAASDEPTTRSAGNGKPAGDSPVAAEMEEERQQQNEEEEEMESKEDATEARQVQTHAEQEADGQEDESAAAPQRRKRRMARATVAPRSSPRLSASGAQL